MSKVPVWICGRHVMSFDKPAIMAIINVTPDSFSGDGLSGSVGAALRQAERALENGASILDVGGESTRPGAESVPVEEEVDRVVPVVEALSRLGVPVSVDTLKPQVMLESIRAGASVINDINALRAPGAIEVVAASDAGVCIMHMKGVPRTMQESPLYEDVVNEVAVFLDERVEALLQAGISRERICLDPGFGFGKTAQHNIELFRGMGALVERGLPVLVGVSRKSMLGQITGRPVGERVVASAVAATLAAAHGASVLRVHDVAETKDALAVWSALNNDFSGARAAA